MSISCNIIYSNNKPRFSFRNVNALVVVIRDEGMYFGPMKRVNFGKLQPKFTNEKGPQFAPLTLHISPLSGKHYAISNLSMSVKLMISKDECNK